MLKVEEVVPKQYRAYVRNKWLDKEINWLKTQTTSHTPHYRNLSELGLFEEYHNRLKQRQEDNYGKN